MKNVLITGGAGFIGYHLALSLSKLNFKIYLIDNLSRGKIDHELKELLKKKNVSLIKYNLNNKLNLKIKFDFIYHLAAVVGVANVNRDPSLTITNNIIPLINLLDFIKNKNTVLIFFSTSEVYSPLIKNKKIIFPLKENNDLMIPNNIISRDTYFISKLFCEKILQSSKSKHIIFRPHNIYGPRMGYSHVVPELIKKMQNNSSKVTIFSPSHKRAFCYIDDAVNQIIGISINLKNKNKIFNIGNQSEEVRIFDLAKKILNLLKQNNKLKRGIITEGSPHRRLPNMKLTLSKIKSKKFTNLNEGLSKTISWYLNEKN
jgi:UDP-glucose 4-epimerase